MAIARVNIPTPTAPVVVADYQAQLDQITALNQAFTGRNPVDGSTIRAGVVMMIGSVLYKATSDTTITGSTSLYVKITPSGATASASFVASLSGVTWNHAYGGYYDGSDNLYLFDEALAINAGAGPTTPYTLLGTVRLDGAKVLDKTLTSIKMAASSRVSHLNIGALVGTYVVPALEIDETKIITTNSGASNPALQLPGTTETYVAVGIYSGSAIYPSGGHLSAGGVIMSQSGSGWNGWTAIYTRLT